MFPSQADWVDRVVGSGANVSLVGGPRSPDGRVERDRVLELLDRPASTTRACRTSVADYGEQQLAAGSAARARYAVVPASLRISGRVLARDPLGHLVLVAPTGGTVRVPSALRCGR